MDSPYAASGRPHLLTRQGRTDVTSSGSSPQFDDTATPGRRRVWTIASIAALGLTALGAGTLIAADASTPATGAAPATTTAPSSPIVANPAGSRPTGLEPDNATTSIVYPGTPIVLSWSKVKGATKYRVEISPVANFAQVSWLGETDQTQVAPTVLLSDAVYYWRVTAQDASGNLSLPSESARVKKSWDAKVSGLKSSEQAGGPATALFSLQPYFAWTPLPGASTYDVEISPADRFADPFTITNTWVPSGDTLAVDGGSALLPDDSYQWRVRAKDANLNYGEWSLPQAFTKAWGVATPTAPADGASVEKLHLQWAPVPGAERYDVQITNQQHTFEGGPLIVSQSVANLGWSPSDADKESMSQGVTPAGYGTHWWRVRARVGAVVGAWSPVRRVTWTPPTTTVTTIQLQQVPDVETAVMPVLSWGEMDTATLYRVDIAADRYFNNVVHREYVPQAIWHMKETLADNQVGIGYYWRVVWGTGDTDNPVWQVDEATVPVGQFRKQVRITPTPLASTNVSEPPAVAWSSVVGAGRYKVEAAPTNNFEKAATSTTEVYGTSVIPNSMANSSRMKDGTWYWRVRSLDGSGIEGTWSAVQQFTLQSPSPKLSEPDEAFESAGSPLLRWQAVVPACGYEVAMSTSSGFPDTASRTVKTPQVALVPTGTELTTLGKWYWRVRADHCNGGGFSPWSETRSFTVTGDPDFGLKKFKKRVVIGERLRISGRLRFAGKSVSRPDLVLERKFPNADFEEIAKIKGDGFGQFMFRLAPQRTASYRILWKRTNGSGGETAFGLGVTPRLVLKLGTAKVLRGGKLKVSGTVSPARPVKIEVRTRSGWQTLKTITPKGTTFAATIPANIEPGRLKLRASTRPDAKLASALSSLKNLFVYDKFVLVSGVTP